MLPELSEETKKGAFMRYRGCQILSYICSVSKSAPLSTFT